VRLDAESYSESLELARRRRGGLVQRGTRNKPAIKALQEKLTQLGFAVEIDGLFGQETEQALRAFQDSRGAKVDGKVGKETLGKLLRATPKEPNAADIGIDAIQRVVEKGAPVTSERTKGLGDIRARQRGGGRGRRGPSSDSESGRKGGTRGGSSRGRGSGGSGSGEAKGPHGGSIDPVTGKEVATSKTGPIGSTTPPGQASNADFEKLHPRGGTGTPEGGKFVKKGDEGDNVENTQKAINKLYGYDRKPDKGLDEDGQFGDKTEAAVKDFQKNNNLVTDGIVGPKTSGMLRRRLRQLKGKRRS
jgi:peptidoglycan hydrolase-like protein with peptidoglycan-binding domain